MAGVITYFQSNLKYNAVFFRLFNTQLTETNVQYVNKFLLLTGFEPWTSGIGSDCSTNRATTTAICNAVLVGHFQPLIPYLIIGNG